MAAAISSPLDDREMKLLLMNTCGAEGVAALAEDASVAGVEVLPGRSSSEGLMPAVARLLAQRGWTVRDLTAVGVVVGPGSFTGVRVGLSFAKGLCEAGSARMIAMSRLELVAMQISLIAKDNGAMNGAQAEPGSSGSRVVGVLDAGRGEYYCGVYAGTGDDCVCVGEELLKLDATRERMQHSVAVTCEKRVAESLGIKLVSEPGAAEMLTLALNRIAADEWSDVASADANYLRRTDAELLKGGLR